ncbi:tyrosine-type recombinase/integrase [Vibrio splendidus]
MRGLGLGLFLLTECSEGVNTLFHRLITALSYCTSQEASGKDSLYVFSSPTDKLKPLNRQTVNTALKRMGYRGKLVSHGFRTIASTSLSEEGFNFNLIEAALAHVDAN